MTEHEVARPYVLAFVGENANEILRWWTEKILAGLEKHGLSHELINIRETGWQARLNEAMAAGKPEFCFSFQGIGMDVRLDNGDNLWTRTDIPFVSYLGDNPYHAPRLHAAEGPGMYLLYGCTDFLETYKRFLNGRAYATTALFHYPENPLAGRTPWSKREHDIVLVKAGINSKAMRTSWDGLPHSVRDIFLDSAALVLTGADETVSALCAKVFSDRQIHWGERRELFLSVCSQVDFYVRAVRAERMVTALMRQNALIVGDWSHLDQSRARARFLGPIAASGLDELYAETRVLVNTLPSSRFGVHDRIMAGMLAKAAVLSDTTPFLDRMLRKCPSFLGVKMDGLDQGTFTDQVDRTLTACFADPATSSRVQSSYEVARELFSVDNFIQQLLDHVALDKLRKTLGWWTFPPA